MTTKPKKNKPVDDVDALKAENAALRALAVDLRTLLLHKTLEADRLKKAMRPPGKKMNPKSTDPFERPWDGR